MSSASKRHYIFILLISTMMVTNGLVLWFAHNQQFLFATHLSQATVLLFTVLISIIAGRTFPFFTERGLKNVTLKKTKILDVLIPVASIINVVIFLSSISNQFKVLAAILLMVTGLLHCIRLLYWKPQLTVKTPLLWSLQLSYGFLGIGLITLGMSYLMVGIRFNDALHLLTIGTMGAMILSIMSRVSLGHTGQPIVASRLIIVAFMGVFVSALIRFLLPLLMEFQLSWNLSGFFWVMSFTIFIIKFTPILVSPKA